MGSSCVDSTLCGEVMELEGTNKKPTILLSYACENATSAPETDDADAGEGCYDADEECSDIKEWGECDLDPEYMSEICRKSCGYCSV